jgi:anhydro-N-acetylmuramic acid kinase
MDQRERDLRAEADRRPLVAIGLMSGTSADGVDVALIETDGQSIGRFGPSATYPYEQDERQAIKDAFGRDSEDDVTRRAGQVVTDAHIRAVQRFVADNGLSPAGIDVVGFHGQTIYHRPERRFTWQIGDGAALAARIGMSVVDGMRLADVAAGGQGAPLVPVFHAALAQRLPRPVAILNIGGVANVTWIGPGNELLAFDTGPGNAPLDDWVRRHSTMSRDEDGAISAKGTVVSDVLRAFLSAPYLSRKPPKSLDRNDFSFNFNSAVNLMDGAATLVTCTAQGVAEATRHFPAPAAEWIICGGGARNPTIMRELARVLGAPLRTADDLGWDGDAIEAQAFAFLAVRSVRNLPITFPTTTGCPAPMTGGRLHPAAPRA